MIVRPGMVLPAFLLCAAHAVPAWARVHDQLFKGSFDVPADAPASDAEAARFLTQATFGPTRADIAYLRAVGYRQWIAMQLAKPATLGRAYVQSVIAARTAGGQNVNQNQRRNRWTWQAAFAPDQLRQRMAFALSQIFVVSDQSGAINQDLVPMSEYQDLLARDAFGTYRQLLGDVTWNPTMGKYLSSFRNQKPGPSTQPDENYAREVMQLFSVGLVLRDLDYTPITSGGVPIPTYDQSTITHTAKVFTGFTYSDAPTSPPSFFGGGYTDAGTYNPMACWGTELFGANSNQMRHDITGDDGTTLTSKTVLGGLTLPPGQTCAQDVNGELDIIAGHANVAPFIARQLIQRFVTSNPSGDYVRRVAQVFENNGYGDRGDLGDVIAAVLLDSEARTPPPLAAGDTYGKLREPLLRLTAVWRAFDAVPPAPDAYGEVKMMGNTNFQAAYGQSPLGAPTVFNFYTPDFAPPGAFASAGKAAPEFQITNESSVYLTADSYYSFTAKAYVGMANPPDDRPLLDLSALTANAGNPALLVDTINASLLYGSMSPSMRSTLIGLVGDLAASSPAEQAWSAVYLTVASPEYATQR